MQSKINTKPIPINSTKSIMNVKDSTIISIPSVYQLSSTLSLATHNNNTKM